MSNGTFSMPSVASQIIVKNSKGSFKQSEFIVCINDFLARGLLTFL